MLTFANLNNLGNSKKYTLSVIQLQFSQVVVTCYKIEPFIGTWFQKLASKFLGEIQCKTNFEIIV